MVQKMAPENSGSRSRKGFFLRTKTKECSHVVAIWGYSWFLPNHSFTFQLFWHGQHLETIHIDFFCFFSKHNCYFLRNIFLCPACPTHCILGNQPLILFVVRPFSFFLCLSPFPYRYIHLQMKENTPPEYRMFHYVFHSN